MSNVSEYTCLEVKDGNYVFSFRFNKDDPSGSTMVVTDINASNKSPESTWPINLMGLQRAMAAFTDRYPFVSEAALAEETQPTPVGSKDKK